MHNQSSNTALAYKKLKVAILSNEIASGTQMLEREAAEHLGMSRTPVREAMLLLQRDGLVQVRARHGMTVLPISQQDLKELFELFFNLETVAVRQAALNWQESEQLEELSQAIKQMQSAIELHNMLSWTLADRHFHEHIPQIAGNSRMLRILTSLRDQSHRLHLQFATAMSRPLYQPKQLEQIYLAIRNREAEHAAELHLRHLQDQFELLSLYLQQSEFA